MESNHRSPGCHPGVFAIGPRDLPFFLSVTEVGVEPTKSSGSRPDRFASLRTQSYCKWRVRGSHPTGKAYETSLSTGSPALIFVVAKGRFELPRHKWHDVLSVACLPFHHFAMSGPGRSRTATVRRPLVYSQLGSPMHADPCLCYLFSDPYENRTHLSSVRDWRPTDRRTGRVIPPVHFQ